MVFAGDTLTQLELLEVRESERGALQDVLFGWRSGIIGMSDLRSHLLWQLLTSDDAVLMIRDRAADAHGIDAVNRALHRWRSSLLAVGTECIHTLNGHALMEPLRVGFVSDVTPALADLANAVVQPPDPVTTRLPLRRHLRTAFTDASVDPVTGRAAGAVCAEWLWPHAVGFAVAGQTPTSGTLRPELMSIMLAILLAPRDADLMVYSDNTGAVNIANAVIGNHKQRRSRGSNGWLRVLGAALSCARADAQTTVQHISAHSNRPGNVLADGMAKVALDSFDIDTIPLSLEDAVCRTFAPVTLSLLATKCSDMPLLLPVLRADALQLYDPSNWCMMRGGTCLPLGEPATRTSALSTQHQSDVWLHTGQVMYDWDPRWYCGVQVEFDSAVRTLTDVAMIPVTQMLTEAAKAAARTAAIHEWSGLPLHGRVLRCVLGAQLRAVSVQTSHERVPQLPRLVPARDRRQRRILALVLASDLPVLAQLAKREILMPHEPTICVLCEEDDETQLHLLELCCAIDLPDLPPRDDWHLDADAVCFTDPNPGPSRREKLPLLMAYASLHFVAGLDAATRVHAATALNTLCEIWSRRRECLDDRLADMELPRAAADDDASDLDDPEDLELVVNQSQAMIDDDDDDDYDVATQSQQV